MSDWRALERPPWPLWMLVCVALDKHRATGLSIEHCSRAVRELSHGRYSRRATVSTTLRHMRACGYAAAELVPAARVDMPATKIHRLTARGTARLLRALEDIAETYAHLGIRYN